jgi:hypothetical protein
MSTIQDKLKESKQVYFLLECDFGGLVKRYATKDIPIGDYHFAGKIVNIGGVGTQFNLRTFQYSRSGISVTIANDERLQDEETRRVLDGSICTLRIWCEGLTWANIDTEGKILTGRFKKQYHTNGVYVFSVETLKSTMRMIPGAYINDTTFANHRKAGGAGSVSGKPIPLVFGDFPGGIPLLCTHTSNYEYAVALGVVKSTDAEYTATTENVLDKDGGTVSAAGYELKSGVTDGKPYTYFDFSGDQASSESLSCSIRGLTDASGEITGTADALIEHPADIIRYLIKNYAIDFTADKETLGTMKALLPGLKFAAYINASAKGEDLCQRIASEALASMLMSNGRIGVVVINPFADIQAKYRLSHHNIAGDVRISKTENDNVCNKLIAKYKLNMVTGQYEGQLTRDRDNNEACNLSYYEYGERPAVVLSLPDVQRQADAEYIAHRYLTVHSHRHDIIELTMAYGDGWDIREGDCANWTMPEGPSRDGNGYVDEKFILLDRKFTPSGISQRWWRVRVNMEYGGEIVEAEPSADLEWAFKDTGGIIFEDTAGVTFEDT